MPKKDAKREEEDDSDDESDEPEDAQEDEEPRKTRGFKLSRSAKLALFNFVMFILVMSDVFVLRVMGRAEADLVVGRTPTRRGMVVQGVLISIALIAIDFLIAKEKL